MKMYLDGEVYLSYLILSYVNITESRNIDLTQTMLQL